MIFAHARLNSTLRPHGLIGLGLVCMVSGCARQEGAVELDWSIVDGDFEDLFPGQRYSSSCEFKNIARFQLPANGVQGNAIAPIDVDLKLQLRLRVFDCPEDATVQSCEQSPIVDEKTFDCDHMRGTIGKLPSVDRSYLFVVDTIITPSQGPSFVPLQRCVATPGSRRRRIRAGQITNLAVYQVVVQGTASRPLLIQDCIPPKEADATGTGSATATSSESSSAPVKTSTQDSSTDIPQQPG